MPSLASTSGHGTSGRASDAEEDLNHLRKPYIVAISTGEQRKIPDSNLLMPTVFATATTEIYTRTYIFPYTTLFRSMLKGSTDYDYFVTVLRNQAPIKALNALIDQAVIKARRNEIERMEVSIICHIGIDMTKKEAYKRIDKRLAELSKLEKK